MQKDFNELVQLLKLDSTNDLFVFENGKVKYYYDRLEFQYHLSNFYEFVLSEVSNIEVSPRRLNIIETSVRFIAYLRKIIPF